MNLDISYRIRRIYILAISITLAILSLMLMDGFIYRFMYLSKDEFIALSVANTVILGLSIIAYLNIKKNY